MSRENELFDDFLKRKLDAKEFELRESYWQNARTLLDQHKIALRRKFTSAAFSGLLVISAFAGFIIHSTLRNPMAVQAPAIAQMKTESFQSASVPNKTNESISITKPIAGDQIKNSKDDRQVENTYQTKHEAVARPNQANHFSTPASSPVSSINITGNETPQTTPPVQPENNLIIATVVVPSSIPETIIAAPENNEISHPVTSSASNEDAIIEVIMNKAGESILIDSKIFEGLFALAAIPGDTPVKLRDIYRNEQNRMMQQRFLTAEAGINCYNAGSSVADALNFHAGLRYFYFVSQRIAINTGITYSRQHQNLNERTYQNTSYSFGAITSTTGIKTVRLDYIEIPLNVCFNIAGNHYLTGGTNFAYLLQSQEMMRVQQGESETNKPDNGHKKAINPVDVQFNVGYMFMLPGGFNASAGFYFGAADITKNQYFSSSTTNRNNGVRITIGYRLFN